MILAKVDRLRGLESRFSAAGEGWIGEGIFLFRLIAVRAVRVMLGGWKV